MELNIETGTTNVHEDGPAVHMTREEKGINDLNKTQIGDGERDRKVVDGDGGGGDEKVQTQEEEHGKDKVAADGNSKEPKDTETGDKRQRPADLDVGVPEGEEQGETGAKKARVTERKPVKKESQPKQANAKTKKGPGRPRKSGTKKKVDADIEGGQKPDVKVTAKAVD